MRKMNPPPLNFFEEYEEHFKISEDMKCIGTINNWKWKKTITKISGRFDNNCTGYKSHAWRNHFAFWNFCFITLKTFCGIVETLVKTFENVQRCKLHLSPTTAVKRNKVLCPLRSYIAKWMLKKLKSNIWSPPIVWPKEVIEQLEVSP